MNLLAQLGATTITASIPSSRCATYSVSLLHLEFSISQTMNRRQNASSSSPPTDDGGGRKRVGKACDRCRNKKSKVRATSDGTPGDDKPASPRTLLATSAMLHELTGSGSAMESSHAIVVRPTTSSACIRSATKLRTKSGPKVPWRRC